MGHRKVALTEDGNLSLTQWDIRELQKAKGAIRAAMDTLLAQLDLKPTDLKRIILTGSFGGQIEIEVGSIIGYDPANPFGESANDREWGWIWCCDVPVGGWF